MHLVLVKDRLSNLIFPLISLDMFCFIQQEGFTSKFRVKGDAEDDNMDVSSPMVLVDLSDTQISAHADQTPASEPQDVKFTYHYGSSFVLGESSHRGLGFSEELEETPSGVEATSKQMEEPEDMCFGSLSSEKDANQGIDYEDGDDMAEDLPTEVMSSDENEGFLSFGGIRLYTQDISDAESEEDENGASLYEGNSESSESGDSEDSYSDIDDEVAEDYLEGIGGSDNILRSKWLLEQQLDMSDTDSSSSSDFDETVEKLGGIALQEASREYGKRNARSQKKHNVTEGYAQPLAIDDLMLVKDPRIRSAKKKPVTRFPQSWPSERSKYSRNIPGKDYLDMMHCMFCCICLTMYMHEQNMIVFCLSPKFKIISFVSFILHMEYFKIVLSMEYYVKWIRRNSLE